MRKYLFIITVGWMLPVLGIIGINWLVDPCRIFHKPWIRDNYYASDPGNRIGASGIINSEDFDSIILGTSMAANFSPNEATRIFGRKFVNISLDGSAMTERSVVLNYALKNRNLSQVIFSLDGLLGSKNSITNTPIYPYAYLYDEKKLNDFLIYASNLTTLRFALCRNLLVSSNALCQKTRDLETLVEWHSDWEHSKRFGGLDKWLEAKNNGQIQDALKSISRSIQTINSGEINSVDWTEVARARDRHEQIFRERLLDLVDKYPATEFYLFFPPYSRLNYAITKQSNPQEFENYLEILRFVVGDCSKYSNVKVFGFENEDFPDDIANYKDTSHYHQRFNSAMLTWMKNGDHELTPSNLDAYIGVITERAEHYPLKEFGAKIDAYLRDVR